MKFFNEKALTEKQKVVENQARKEFKNQGFSKNQTDLLVDAIVTGFRIGRKSSAEDLRAWVEDNAEEIRYCLEEHVIDCQKADHSFVTIEYVDARKLLAELSKTGGSSSTREKPPPRSFL